MTITPLIGKADAVLNPALNTVLSDSFLKGMNISRSLLVSEYLISKPLTAVYEDAQGRLFSYGILKNSV